MKVSKFFILLNFMFFYNLHAQIFVSASAAGLGNGSSWQNAFNDLQKAINTAKSGDQIWVKAGSYYPSLDRNGVKPSNPRNAVFVLKEGVKMYGGFAGFETSLSERNSDVNVTVLSGDIGAVNDDSDNIYSLLLCLDLTSSSRIDGFTISKANNNQPNALITIGGYDVAQRSGGAGWLLSSDIIIANNKFIGNKSTGIAGGLIVLHGSKPVFINNVFTANESVNQGGGIYASGSALSFDSCVFNDNYAGQGAAAYIVNNTEPGFISNCTFNKNKSKADGGALLFYTSDPLKRNDFIITDSKFDRNSCLSGGILNGLMTIATRGGAVYADRTNLNISRCSFTNSIIDFNSSGGAQGGAIDLGTDTSAKINKCLFINNKAVPRNTGTSASGGAVSSMSDFEISNCIFADNYAAGSAGAVEFTTTQSTKKQIVITNSVFYHNTAGRNAGAIYYGTSASSYPVGFTNLTFYGNSAQLQGGALYFSSFSELGQSTQVKNCIFEGNITNDLAYYGTFKNSNILASNNYHQTETSSQSVFYNAADPLGKDGIWATADDGLHVNLCSPLTDTGINEGLILPEMKNLWAENDQDITGGRRIKGKQPDLGAYESDINTAPVLSRPLPAISVHSGNEKIEIDLDAYFFIAAGSRNSYRLLSISPESGLYDAAIAGNVLTVSFHESKTGSGQINIEASNYCGLVSNETINVVAAPVLSREDFDNSNSLFIYPVPSMAEITVSGSSPVSSYKIINLLGQTVSSGVFDDRKADISKLATGVYYIEIKSGERSYTLKFIKR